MLKIGLIAAGALIFALSFGTYARIIGALKRDGTRRRWEALLALTALFLVGYVCQIAMEYYQTRIDQGLLMSLIYFFGAVYVYSVVSLSWTTISQLNERERGILEAVNEKEKSRKTLQEKVEELEKLQKLMIDREMRLIELKRRVKELEEAPSKASNR